MRVTYKACVRLHTQRKDKTFRVYIRVGLNSAYSYIETKWSVSKSGIKGYSIKPGTTNDKCNKLIADYREITESMPDIETKGVSDVVAYIEHKEKHKDNIDFILYFKNHVDKLINENAPSRQIYNATFNHFKTYIGKDKLSINEVTAKTLKGFEKYLTDNNVGLHGIHSYMSKMRAVFNLCIDDFEDLGYKFNYPFRKYKLPRVIDDPTIALTKDQIIAIRDIELQEGSRSEYIRDTFMISLLTLGTNATDLFDLEVIRNGRLEYCRNKTKDRRTDKAFISIKVEPELIPYLEKLKGNNSFVFNYAERYSNKTSFNNSIRKGVKEIANAINIYYKEKDPKRYSDKNFIDSFDFYDARRSLASIMRNTLGVSKDDVGLCLNHEDNREHKATNYYIEKDFSILDKCNRKFIDWLYDKKSNL